MTAFRITKYNPRNRDAAGRYLAPEWTSVSDIGRIYEGRTLTLDEYLRVEDAYVTSVKHLLAISNTDALRVVGLESKGDYRFLPRQLRALSEEHARQISEGSVLRGSAITWAVRLNLRELLWCRLCGDNNFYVHFGYDYYMYAGFHGGRGLTKRETPDGLFLEDFESPYFPQAET